MFFPEKMAKITLVAPKTHMEAVFTALQSLQVLHMEEYIPRRQGDLPIAAPLKDAERISELLLSIDTIRKQIFLDTAPAKKVVWNLRKMDGFIRRVRRDVDELSRRVKDVGDALKEEERTAAELSFLASCGIHDHRVLGEYASLQMRAGHASAVPETGAIVFAGKGRPVPLVVFFKKGDKDQVERALQKAKFAEFKLSVPLAKDIPAMRAASQRRMDELRGEKLELLSRLEGVGKQYGALINGIETRLLSLIEQSEAPLKCAASEYVFIVQGWMPDRNKDALAKRLASVPGIYIRIEEAREKNVPTKIENPPAIRPFEFFLNLYSLPAYGEIDPSFLVFLTFPLFYGIMLGDIGYGLVLLALALAIRFRTTKMRALIDITIVSALFTILFGFVFGEVFGAGEFMGVAFHPYINRIEHVEQIILISAGIGLLHINAGFLLGFMNELKHHGLRKALFGKFAWIVFQAGAILLILDAMRIVRTGLLPAALMIGALLALLSAEGLFSLIEIPSLAGNILSYLRLAALGLASASLAIVVNKMAAGMFQAGGAMAFAGIIILVLGHTVNLGLGILGSFLHSLRLHYVEMFTKFYHGSGKPYRPFGMHDRKLEV